MPRASIEDQERRKYDALVKAAVLPSEPHRVKLEQDRFNEMASQAVLPSQQADQARIAQEQARFYEMATKDAGPPAGADSSLSPAVVDQPAADTPVQRTMAYLAKLGGHDDAQPASAGPAPETAQQTQAGAQKDASPYPTSMEDAFRRAVDQAQQPDNPGLSMGPARVFPSKPVLPDSEGRDKVLSDKPLDAQDFVSLFTKAAQAQQSTQPAAYESEGLDAVMHPRLADMAGGPLGGLGTSEEDVGRAVARGFGGEGSSGLPVGGLARGAGEVTGGGSVLGSAGRTEPAPTFFSQLRRTIDEKMPNRASAEQIAGILRGSPVKPDEIKWTGLDDYLRENAGRSISKQDVLDHLDGNAVNVQEVVKGGSPLAEAQRRVEQADRALIDHLVRTAEMRPQDATDLALDTARGALGDYQQQFMTSNPERSRLAAELRDAYATRAANANEDYAAQPKYSRYQLPGGENYRELLITLPDKSAAPDTSKWTVAKESDGWWRVRDENGTGINASPNSADEAMRYAVGITKKRQGDSYRSPHWDEPNVLAHVRFNDRTDAEGKKVLFMEEVQSDWHQAGRQKGYIDPEAVAASDQANRTFDAYQATLREKYGTAAIWPRLSPEERDEWGRLAEAASDAHTDPGAVPPAPFSKTWPELAMKRVLRWAAENGYDRVAWTPGAVQADRYDLSKQVDALHFQPANPASGVPEGSLIAIKDGRAIIERQGVAERDLPDLIGKEAAENLLAGQPDGAGVYHLSGDGLKIGGEGMAAFYDRILPEVANKLGKKYGSRVSTAYLEAPKNGHYANDNPQLGAAIGAEPVWSIDITPEMHRSVLQEGQALFTHPDTVGAVAGGATGYVSQEPQRPDESDEDYQARIAKAVGVGALGGALAPTVARGAGRALGGFLSGESRMVPGTGNAAKPPKEITPEVEALADGPGWPTKTPGWRLRLDRTRNVVGWMGDAGAEIADRAQKWRNDSEVMAADFIRQMPTVRKLSKPEMENLVDVLERGRVGAAAKAVPLNERVVQAAGEAKAVLDDLYTLAQNAGVDVAGKIESYFPHRFKGDVLDRINNRTERAKIVEYLKKTGQADDDAEANQVMQRYVQAASDRRHGSLEMERLANLPGYEKTKEALYAHVLSASRRINEVAAFGRDDAIVNRLIDKLGADGYDVGVARDMFQTIVGAKPQDEWKLARGLRSYNAFTRLGFAALSNATQPVNTASVVGVIRAAQSAPKAIWSKADRDFAEKAGVTLDTVMKEVREGSGWSDRAIPGLGGTSASDIAMPAFNMVESFNRRFTAIAGRDFAIEQARKAVSGNTQARRALDALGLDADAIIRRGGKLNEREQIDAARSMVDRTQFRVDPQDLPAWASSPWGKVFTQFAPFGYQQTLFIGRELLNEAKNGNVMPLVRYAILAPLANAGATEARNALQGRDPEENPYKRVTQYALGTTGTLGNLARAVLPINSQKLPAERQGQMLVGAAFGPSVGLVADAGTSLVQAGHGLARAGSFGLDEKTLRQLTPVGRTALRQLPVFGVPLQNTLLPYDEDKPRLALPGGDGRNDRRDSRRR